MHTSGQWVVRVYNPTTRTAPFYCGGNVTHPQVQCAQRFAQFSQALAASIPLGEHAIVERVRR